MVGAEVNELIRGCVVARQLEMAEADIAQLLRGAFLYLGEDATPSAFVTRSRPASASVTMPSRTLTNSQSGNAS